jgi:two-component system chemotaxis response regulator CheB
MDGLPDRLPSDGGDAFTGLTCPDCRGSLSVGLRGRLAAFTCRVGHVYSADELVAGKEAALECRLWEAVYAFEEMGALLDDLVRLGLADALEPAAGERVRQAHEHAAGLRSIIQVDRPVGVRDHGQQPGQAMPS